MDEGPETIDDAEELAAVRAQARRIHVQALAAAVLGTAATLFLP